MPTVCAEYVRPCLRTRLRTVTQLSRAPQLIWHILKWRARRTQNHLLIHPIPWSQTNHKALWPGVHLQSCFRDAGKWASSSVGGGVSVCTPPSIFHISIRTQALQVFPPVYSVSRRWHRFSLIGLLHLNLCLKRLERFPPLRPLTNPSGGKLQHQNKKHVHELSQPVSAVWG